MDISLSLIMPAYNEAGRLPPYLASVRPYLDKRYAGCYEVIVVDDGSRDDLPEVLDRLAADWPQLAVMRHPINRGKGAAVRTGMLAAGGRLLLFADADGATPIDQEMKLAEGIQAGADVAVGSRLVDSAEVTRRRTRIRGLVGRLFPGRALGARQDLTWVTRGKSIVLFVRWARIVTESQSGTASGKTS